MATCPALTFPVPIQDKTFSLVMTVVTPIFVVVCVTVFIAYRPSSVFIRKRPLWLVLVTALSVIDAWAITPLYDVIGASNYPCWLFGLLFHMFIPLACVPLALKASLFFTKLMQIREELRPRQSFRSSVGDELDINGIVPAANFTTFAAHIRMALRMARPTDRALNLQFAKTNAFVVWWFFFIASPSIFTFIARIASEPLWNQGCFGCEAGYPDMGVSLFMYGMGAPLGIISHSRRVHSKDPLRIVRECHFGWMQGFFCVIGASLWFADPGRVYAQGIFNWRMLLMFGAMSLLYVQTIHQVVIAHREKAALMTTIPSNRAEAFSNMMKDKTMREAFRNYLNSELSPEIYLFMESVDKFRNLPASDERDKRAKKIFETFIPWGASYEVNLSAPVRYELLGIFGNTAPRNSSGKIGEDAGHFGTTIFDNAYAEIKDHLLNDSFLRFFTRVKSTRSLNPITKSASETPRSMKGETPRSGGVTPKTGTPGPSPRGFFVKDATDDVDREASSNGGGGRMVTFVDA